MLEFIVLGKVPGTEIFLPFYVVAPLLVAALAAALYYMHGPSIRQRQKQIEHTIEISL